MNFVNFKRTSRFEKKEKNFQFQILIDRVFHWTKKVLISFFSYVSFSRRIFMSMSILAYSPNFSFPNTKPAISQVFMVVKAKKVALRVWRLTICENRSTYIEIQ